MNAKSLFKVGGLLIPFVLRRGAVNALFKMGGLLRRSAEQRELNPEQLVDALEECFELKVESDWIPLLERIVKIGDRGKESWVAERIYGNEIDGFFFSHFCPKVRGAVAPLINS